MMTPWGSLRAMPISRLSESLRYARQNAESALGRLYVDS